MQELSNISVIGMGLREPHTREIHPLKHQCYQPCTKTFNKESGNLCMLQDYSVHNTIDYNGIDYSISLYGLCYCPCYGKQLNSVHYIASIYGLCYCPCHGKSKQHRLHHFHIWSIISSIIIIIIIIIDFVNDRDAMYTYTTQYKTEHTIYICIYKTQIANYTKMRQRVKIMKYVHLVWRMAILTYVNCQGKTLSTERWQDSIYYKFAVRLCFVQTPAEQQYLNHVISKLDMHILKQSNKRFKSQQLGLRRAIVHTWIIKDG